MTTPTPPEDWFLAVPPAHRDALGGIRHWPALRIGIGPDVVWVTGFSSAQLTSPLVQSIPSQSVYYRVGEKLFQRGSLLPERSVPAVLWSPIERGLAVTLPPFRGNYTHEPGPIVVQLVPSAGEQRAVGMIVSLADLGQYINSASAGRLGPLRWAGLGAGQALLLGTPPLPLPGEALWSRGHHLLPAGYDFDLFVLADQLTARLNPDGRTWLRWLPDATYVPIPDALLQPLSIRSVRAMLNP